MLLKCPECNRSYPSHHGDMCKTCATKKGITPTSQTQSTSNVAIKKEKDDFLDIGAKMSASTKSEAGGQSQLKDLSSFAGETAMRDSSKVMDVCPQCELPNGTLAPFCTDCGKMLVISASEKKVFDYPITELKGIDNNLVAKLKKDGIDTTIKLLGRANNPIKRKSLADRLGMPEILLSRYVHQCDLVRVEGIDPYYANLLDNIGIPSLSTLSRKQSKDIMTLITQKKPTLHSRQILIFPDEKLVKKWLEDAKVIEKVMT